MKSGDLPPDRDDQGAHEKENRLQEKAKKAPKKEAQNQPVLAPLKDFVKVQLFDTVMTMGMQLVYEILEEKRKILCSALYRHEENREEVRVRKTKGKLPMGVRAVTLQKQRERRMDGRMEIPQDNWEQFHRADPLTERAIGSWWTTARAEESDHGHARQVGSYPTLADS